MKRFHIFVALRLWLVLAIIVTFSSSFHLGLRLRMRGF